VQSKKSFGPKHEDREDEECDPPSSAEIEVVHTRPSPSLQGILKQRSISESSEDVTPDPESPRSPGADEADLSSSQGSNSSNGMKQRSVSFSDHIDKVCRIWFELDSVVDEKVLNMKICCIPCADVGKKTNDDVWNL
jgi:hypothetical protein